MTVIEITDETYDPEGDTIVLGPGDVLRGTGSKHCKIESTNDVIIKVSSNFGDWSNTALIENIAIKGNNDNNQIAILLEDVYGCQIRNTAITDVGTGVKLYTHGDGVYMQANNMEHVRMTKVNKGIHFAKGGYSTGKFGYMHVTDTSINLDKEYGSVAKGILVDGPCNLHSSFVKANVWLDNDSDYGMYIHGAVKYSLINLTVENVQETENDPLVGGGIFLGPYACVTKSAGGYSDYNQQIFLATLSTNETKYVVNGTGKPSYITHVKVC